MANLLDNQIKIFVEALADGITTFGFSKKFMRGTRCLYRKTDAGLIGIFVGQRKYRNGTVLIDLSVGVSNSLVQEKLVQTSLYNTEYHKWSSGLTWTFGCPIHELKKEQRSFFDRFRKTTPIDDYDFGTTDSAEKVRIFGRDAAERVRLFAWPFLKQVGLTNEQTFRFALGNDRIANFCFLTKSKKALTGLILARQLGHEEFVHGIIRDTRKWFAKVESPDRAGEFERILKELGY